MTVSMNSSFQCSYILLSVVRLLSGYVQSAAKHPTPETPQPRGADAVDSMNRKIAALNEDLLIHSFYITFRSLWHCSVVFLFCFFFPNSSVDLLTLFSWLQRQLKRKTINHVQIWRVLRLTHTQKQTSVKWSDIWRNVAAFSSMWEKQLQFLP